jgi:hypothetical protein
MNFRVDRGASQQEMEAVVSRAFDALESGETREVALLFTDADEGGGAFENAPLEDKEDEDKHSSNDNNRNVDTNPVVDENIAPVVECVGCGEEPCVFFTTKTASLHSTKPKCRSGSGRHPVKQCSMQKAVPSANTYAK